MPGGIWTSQNKALPGVYIRFKTGTAWASLLVSAAL